MNSRSIFECTLLYHFGVCIFQSNVQIQARKNCMDFFFFTETVSTKTDSYHSWFIRD